MSAGMNTQEKILLFGKREFLQKGFQNASLRNIAAAAGMTTGAIYTYFHDKNALFETIVSPVCEQMEKLFTELSSSYYMVDGAVSETSKQKTIAALHHTYGFIYDHYDIFRLLIMGAEGSSKASYLHMIVDREVANALAYFDWLQKEKNMGIPLNRTLVHLVTESHINAVFESVRHNMSYEEAIETSDFLCAFYTGGWKNVLCELFGYF